MQFRLRGLLAVVLIGTIALLTSCESGGLRCGQTDSTVALESQMMDGSPHNKEELSQQVKGMLLTCPEDAFLLRVLFHASLSTRDYTVVEHAFRELEKKGVARDNERISMAFIAFNNNEYTKAKEYFEGLRKPVEVSGEIDLMYAYAETLVESGQPVKALKILNSIIEQNKREKSLERMPEYYSAFVLASEISLSAHQYRAAMDYSSRAVLVDSDRKDAYLLVLASAEKLGQLVDLDLSNVACAINYLEGRVDSTEKNYVDGAIAVLRPIISERSITCGENK